MCVCVCVCHTHTGDADHSVVITVKNFGIYLFIELWIPPPSPKITEYNGFKDNEEKTIIKYDLTHFDNQI